METLILKNIITIIQDLVQMIKVQYQVKIDSKKLNKKVHLPYQFNKELILLKINQIHYFYY